MPLLNDYALSADDLAAMLESGDPELIELARRLQPEAEAPSEEDDATPATEAEAEALAERVAVLVAQRFAEKLEANASASRKRANAKISSIDRNGLNVANLQYRHTAHIAADIAKKAARVMQDTGKAFTWRPARPARA